MLQYHCVYFSITLLSIEHNDCFNLCVLISPCMLSMLIFQQFTDSCFSKTVLSSANRAQLESLCMVVSTARNAPC